MPPSLQRLFDKKNLSTERYVAAPTDVSTEDFLDIPPSVQNISKMAVSNDTQKVPYFGQIFALIPVICIPFICHTEVHGYVNSTTESPFIPTFNSSISTASDFTYVDIQMEDEIIKNETCMDTQMELRSTKGESDDILRAAIIFFGSLPGALTVCFLVLGKFS
jgi:hypothetical protein